MDEKQRVANFKEFLECHKRNSNDLEDSDGRFRRWQDLSPEGRMDNIARDAAFYDVPFEHFAEAVRESVDSAAIEEAALRLAMRSVREMHDLENQFLEEGLTGRPPLILVKSAGDPENEESTEDEAWLTAEEQAALFKEMREEEEAARLGSSHRTTEQKKAFREFVEEKAKGPVAKQGNDRDIER